VQLKAWITDIWGTPRTYLEQFSNLEVRDPVNDSRTAKLLLSMYDPAVRYVMPLQCLLKVTYGPFLIFWGYITRPVHDFNAGTVEVNAHDPTLKLKHHYHRYGDMAVDYGYPIDGTGYRVLIESSVPIEPQLDRIPPIPGNGILWGFDGSTPQGPKPTTDPPADSDGIWRRAERGANVWETLVNASQVVGAPDFRFRPVDEEHVGVFGSVPAGFFCELDTFDTLGEDKTKTVVFDCGFGSDSAENIVWEPDGDAVRNYWVQVYPGGERNRADENRKALVHSGASWEQYGIYEGWESSGQKDSKEVLTAKAKAWVRAYAWVPDFFTIQPATDRPGVPRYGTDFLTGDIIRVRAKKGFSQIEMNGRITVTTFTQLDAVSNTKLNLEVVPDYTVDEDSTDPED
jgi:hypothetical protein